MNILENTFSTDNIFDEQTAYFERRSKEIKLKRYPYPHLEEQNLFSDTFYRTMASMMPAPETTVTLKSVSPIVGKTYSEQRHVLMIKDLFKQYKFLHNSGLPDDHQQWLKQLFNWFSTVLAPKIADLLDVDISNKTHEELAYVVDNTGFSLHPHTDVRQKILTILVYMPDGENMKHAGTNILVPKDRNVIVPKTENFDIVKTTKFIPNNTFSFKRSDISFHSVSEIKTSEPRKLLLYTAAESN